MTYRLSALALLAFFALAAQAADKPKHTPEGIAAVANCYKECNAEYFAHAIREDFGNHSPALPAGVPRTCGVLSESLVAAERCGMACAAIWTAYGSPPSKLKTLYKTDLEADAAKFDAWAYCKDYPRRDALQIVRPWG